MHRQEAQVSVKAPIAGAAHIAVALSLPPAAKQAFLSFPLT
jgi:hypothetical protein